MNEQTVQIRKPLKQAKELLNNAGGAIQDATSCRVIDVPERLEFARRRIREAIDLINAHETLKIDEAQ